MAKFLVTFKVNLFNQSVGKLKYGKYKLRIKFFLKGLKGLQPKNTKKEGKVDN